VGRRWPPSHHHLRRRGRPGGGVRLPRSATVEVTFLALATRYSLTLPLKRTVTLVDTVVLVAIFVAYTLRVAKAPPEAPNLVGPSAWLATLQTPGDGGRSTCRSSAA
jgi:hypothetical protein